MDEQSEYMNYDGGLEEHHGIGIFIVDPMTIIISIIVIMMIICLFRYKRYYSSCRHSYMDNIDRR